MSGTELYEIRNLARARPSQCCVRREDAVFSVQAGDELCFSSSIDPTPCPRASGKTTRIASSASGSEALQEAPKHDKAKLQQLEVTLDQCWDLLRQRRARQEFGLDPSVVSTRDPNTVENYQQ